MLVKPLSFLPAIIKSMNPMQKYPHITESFACTRKMFDMIFLCPIKPLTWNMFNTKTIEISNFISVTK